MFHHSPALWDRNSRGSKKMGTFWKWIFVSTDTVCSPGSSSPFFCSTISYWLSNTVPQAAFSSDLLFLDTLSVLHARGLARWASLPPEPTFQLDSFTHIISYQERHIHPTAILYRRFLVQHCLIYKKLRYHISASIQPPLPTRLSPYLRDTSFHLTFLPLSTSLARQLAFFAAGFRGPRDIYLLFSHTA